MLASIFITSGLDAVRNPQPRAAAAEQVAPQITRRVPYLPEDAESLVRINGAVQLDGGAGGCRDVDAGAHQARPVPIGLR